MRLAKLWGFGDSYTAGAGLENKDEPCTFPYENIYRDTIYLNQLGEELGLEVKNFARNGNSNADILYSIVRNLKNIKKDDVVIIGCTVESRIPIPLPGRRFGVPLSSGLVDCIDKYIKGTIIEYKDECSYCNDLFKIFTKNELKTIHDYFYTFFPKLSIPYYNRYIELFKDIQDLLIKNGNKCIMWDDTCWDEFEKITKWTENSEIGSVADGHWSPNGNIIFKEVLLQALNENTLFVNSELLSKTQWVEKAKEKHEYIPALMKFKNKKNNSLI